MDLSFTGVEVSKQQFIILRFHTCFFQEIWINAENFFIKKMYVFIMIFLNIFSNSFCTRNSYKKGIRSFRYHIHLFSTFRFGWTFLQAACHVVSRIPPRVWICNPKKVRISSRKILLILFIKIFQDSKKLF